MKLIRTLALALFFTIAAPTLHAQEVYLKFTGPNGAVIATDGVTAGLKDFFEANSYNQDSKANCAAGSGTGGATSCQVNTGNFFFVVPLDRSLNPLRTAMYKGEALRKVEVVFQRSFGGRPQTYYSITMETVFIAGIGDANTGGAFNEIELEFNPVKIGFSHFPIDKTTGAPSSNPIKFGWDKSANQEWLSF